jgi:phosphoribosylformylglycinamidine synthase
MGIWISHGEGKALFPSEEIKRNVLSNNLAPIRYSNDAGEATESYPFNPNGSPEVWTQDPKEDASLWKF